MALIECPECNETISDSASACPHCGYPIQPPPVSAVVPVKEKAGCLPISLAVIAVIAFIALVSWGNGPADGDSPYTAISNGKTSIKQSLKDPDSVEFGDVWAAKMTTEDGKSMLVACGYFNARNGFGGMIGSSRFEASPGIVLTDEVNGPLMDSEWQNTCLANRVT